MSRKRCSIQCRCLCHDTEGGVHPHEGSPCPGKSVKIERMEIKIRSCKDCVFYGTEVYAGEVDYICKHPEADYADLFIVDDDEPPPDQCPLRESLHPLILELRLENRESRDSFRERKRQEEQKKLQAQKEAYEWKTYQELKKKFESDGET